MGSIEVTIIGQKYNIKGDAPEEYIQELARFVDRRIKEIYEKKPGITPLKATIIAALNIADELYRYKKTQKVIAEDIEKKTEQLVKLFE
jgi:cell division protein ZapA